MRRIDHLQEVVESENGFSFHDTEGVDYHRDRLLELGALFCESYYLRLENAPAADLRFHNRLLRAFPKSDLWEWWRPDGGEVVILRVFDRVETRNEWEEFVGELKREQRRRRKGDREETVTGT